MNGSSDVLQAAQSHAEAVSFVEAFARVNVELIRSTLGKPLLEAAAAELALHPEWDDAEKLAESGLEPHQVDQETRLGKRYLHVDVASSTDGARARTLFLSLTGLSQKQQRLLFPALSSQPPQSRDEVASEVRRLNAWLDEVRQGGFDPSAFVTYQRGLAIHGQTQNLSGQIGAIGAAIAFTDAIEQLDPAAIVGTVGERPPPAVRSPKQLFAWRSVAPTRRTLKALLLKNGRALVFASSKDANIFMPLQKPFTDADDALKRFNAVRNDQRARAQRLHEFAVGEVKTATDLNNLHERMGLASRETQTELRTDRFLMMAVLNTEILTGGTQGRVMNNRDLVRFSHVFNLHHCWGWDGGRDRHPSHWAGFVECVREWCGL